MIAMIVNNFPNRCKCGTFVKSKEGYVYNRKITCKPCADKIYQAEDEAEALTDPDFEYAEYDYEGSNQYGFDE